MSLRKPLITDKFPISTVTSTANLLEQTINRIDEFANNFTTVNLNSTTFINSGNATINGTTQSTNKDTGCMVLEGGLGVEKNINAGGDMSAVGKVYESGHMLLPTGTILPYAVSSAPSGYLLCDGTAISRTTYSSLFSIIGTTFGSGDGTTTFNVPDMRGKMPFGASPSYSFASTSGSASATLSIANMPSHTHTGTTDAGGVHNHSITDPGHTHTQTTINDDFNNSGENPPGFTADSAGSRTWSNISTNTTGITINNSGSHTHTFTTNSTGSGSSFSILNPYLAISFIIKY
jgi:microcystin-dependent protein